jgi:hypothetical protein
MGGGCEFVNPLTAFHRLLETLKLWTLKGEIPSGNLLNCDQLRKRENVNHDLGSRKQREAKLRGHSTVDSSTPEIVASGSHSAFQASF